AGSIVATLVGGRGTVVTRGGTIAVAVSHRRRSAGNSLRRRAVAPIDRPTANRVLARIAGCQAQRIERSFIHARRTAERQRRGNEIGSPSCRVRGEMGAVLVGGRGGDCQR